MNEKTKKSVKITKTSETKTLLARKPQDYPPLPKTPQYLYRDWIDN